MLEFFRRLRGPILIGITVIIVISFSWWGGSRKGLNPNAMREAHDVAFTLYGQEYTHHDLDKLNRLQALCYYRLGLFEFAFGLPDAAKQIASIERGGPNYDFAGNLLVLREKALEFGVAASDADAKERMKTVQSFQKDGKFDEATAAEQVKQLNDAGFSNQDLLDLMKDVIAYERLQDLVGANYSASAFSAGKSYAAKNQTIKASTITLPLDEFKKKAEVKDDEISKYFEEKKDTFKTAEKRAASYVLFEKPKTDDKKVAEENQKAQRDFETAVNDFDSKLRTPGSDFAALVTEFAKTHPALKLQTLPAFEQATPPEAIKDEAAVVKELFRETLAAGSLTAAVNGTKGYYFLKLTQVDAPKQQELKDVKDKIKDTLVTQKAQEAMMKAANDTRTALADGLKAGKKLDDLAKDKKLKVESLPEFSPANPPPDNKTISQIAKDLGKTPVNGVTKPVSTEAGALLAVVTAKQLYKNETASSLKDSEASQQATAMKSELFKAWFGKMRTEANMQVVQ